MFPTLEGMESLTMSAPIIEVHLLIWVTCNCYIVFRMTWISCVAGWAECGCGSVCSLESVLRGSDSVLLFHIVVLSLECNTRKVFYLTLPMANFIQVHYTTNGCAQLYSELIQAKT